MGVRGWDNLEDDAEEPGKEDVAGHQPGQLPPVLLAVADPHPGGAGRQEGEVEGGLERLLSRAGAGLGRQQRPQPASVSTLASTNHRPPTQNHHCQTLIIANISCKVCMST